MAFGYSIVKGSTLVKDTINDGIMDVSISLNDILLRKDGYLFLPQRNVLFMTIEQV